MAVQEEFKNLNKWNTDPVVLEQRLLSNRYFGAII